MGMLIADAENNLPQFGKVIIGIPPNVSLKSKVTIKLMIRERASHKPVWICVFKFESREIVGETEVKSILLYIFNLTNKGCLNRKSQIICVVSFCIDL